MTKTILITGITGFLGSHLGEYLLERQYNVIGLKRTTSGLWRCSNYTDKILWVDSDICDWKEKIIKLKPDIIIHTAWSGVVSLARTNFKEQMENLNFLSDLLIIAQEIKPEKFIAFGSQAEYGKLNSIAIEDQEVFPETAYAISKVLASKLTAYFCISNKINWVWLRIFSVFGEKESEEWFIPSIIRKIVKNQPAIELSTCDQKYAYLYIKDFVRIIYSFICESPESGIYNVSGTKAISLREVVNKINDHLNNDKVVFKFGTIPLRDDQSMHIEGSMNKYSEQFGPAKFQDFNSSLRNTIDYYKNQNK